MEYFLLAAQQQPQKLHKIALYTFLLQEEEGGKCFPYVGE
jgi:hypothetical protein